MTLSGHPQGTSHGIQLLCHCVPLGCLSTQQIKINAFLVFLHIQMSRTLSLQGDGIKRRIDVYLMCTVRHSRKQRL